jgi:hypothetical protein
MVSSRGSVFISNLVLSLLVLQIGIGNTEVLRKSDNPIEAGSVEWSRDLDDAIKKSGNTGIPVLVLFQEIPGCIGCQTFGREVLTNPLLVEAIETLFIPVLIYNNRPGGKDQEWLQRYREPAWNFQVIRFFGGDGSDIIPRKEQIWSIGGVAARMVDVLRKLGRQVPLYLSALMLEHDTDNHEKIGFAMACFWTGEYQLGRVEGVIATEAGWYDNREVTLVTYHKNLITPDELVEYAASVRCAQRVYPLPGTVVDRNRFESKPLRLENYRPAKESDQKKQLDNWPEIKKISSLTPMQATKINSLAPDNHVQSLDWLSPRQLIELRDLK